MNHPLNNNTLVGYLRIGIMLSLTVPWIARSQQSETEDRFIQLTAGLGVSAHSDPSITNYINALTEPTLDQKLTDFTSASEFFFSPEVQIDDEWSIGAEYSYLLKSYNVTGAYQWNFSYSAQMSTFLLHHLTPGDGYWIKLGGGIGYAFGSLSEEFVDSGAQESSKASGPLVKIEVVGNTKFDEHFWGSIGLDLRWVYAGNFKGGIVSTAPPPKLDFFSAGVKFGVTVQL